MPNIKMRLTVDEMLEHSYHFAQALNRIERLETMSNALETAVQGVAASEANLETRLAAEQATRQAQADALTKAVNDLTVKLGADDQTVKDLTTARDTAVTELGAIQAKLDALDAGTAPLPAPATDPVPPTPAPVPVP